MRHGAVLLALSLFLGNRAIFAAEDGDAEAASNETLKTVQGCASEPGAEGERLSKEGMAILESGEGQLDDALRKLETARSSFERAVACLTLKPEDAARLTDQDREFLGMVRQTMGEGLEKLGSIRELVLSDGVVHDYLVRCKEGPSGSSRTLYTKAVNLRGRKGKTDDEVTELFDQAEARLDAFAACLDSVDRLSGDVSRDMRKVVAKAAKDNDDLRKTVALARAKGDDH